MTKEPVVFAIHHYRKRLLQSDSQHQHQAVLVPLQSGISFAVVINNFGQNLESCAI
jgi:hypothetical protein